MKIRILCASRSFHAFEREWIDDYVRRINRQHEILLTRLKERARGTADQTANATWMDMEKHIPSDAYRVVLDPKGKLFRTEELAEWWGRMEKSHHKAIVFIFGGSQGLPPEARKSADLLLALTSLTLPHRIAILVLTEQIYRVLSLRSGSPYHH